MTRVVNVPGSEDRLRGVVDRILDERGDGMSDQVTVDEEVTRMTFTEQGLADALAAAIEAIEGGDDAASRGQELAANIFLAAYFSVKAPDTFGDLPRTP